jgi:hypothetical protein
MSAGCCGWLVICAQKIGEEMASEKKKIHRKENVMNRFSHIPYRNAR